MFPNAFFPKHYYPARYFPPYPGANIGYGRIEFTVPRSRLEFTLKSRLDFTLPKSSVLFSSFALASQFIEPEGVYAWPSEFLPAEKTIIARNYLDDFDPETVSSVPVDGDGTEIFASPGEYEPASFIVICPDGGPLHVVVSDLTCGAFTISSENIAVRRVVRTPMRDLYNDATETTVVGRFLPSWSLQTVEAGEFREIWLTFHIPAEATPGTYTGTVSVTDHDDWPITVEVLPITLMQSASATIGVQYNLLRRVRDINSELATTEDVLSELTDIGNHGCSSIIPSLEIGWDFTTPDFTELLAGLQLLVDSGIQWRHVILFPNLDTLALNLGHTDVVNGPEDTAGTGESLDSDAVFQAAAAAGVAELETIVEQFKDDTGANFDVILKNCDELFSNKFGVDLSPLYSRYAQVCRENCGLELCTTISTHTEEMDAQRQQIDSLVDIRIHQGFSFEWWLARSGNTFQSYASELTSASDKAWLYHNERGAFHKPAWKRIINGVFLFASPFRMHLPWTYFYNAGDAVNPFDAADGNEFNNFGFAFPSESNGTVPTRAWEAMREGWDDARYFHTLAALINNPPAPIDPDLQTEASQLLSQIYGLPASVDLTVYTPSAGSALESPIIDGLAITNSGDDWQSLRRQAADLIVQIQSA